MQKDYVLKRVKLLLGVEDEDRDALIGAYARECGLRIEHYIGCTMPEGLLPAWAAMTAETARCADISGEIFGSKAVKAVSEGGASVTFESGRAASASADAVFAGYTADLNRYRRIIWDERPGGRRGGR